MSRVKRGIIHVKRRKKVLRAARGYRGKRSKLYTLALDCEDQCSYSPERSFL